MDWLKSDLAQFASSSVHQSYREELQKHVDAVIGLRTEVGTREVLRGLVVKARDCLVPFRLQCDSPMHH